MKHGNISAPLKNANMKDFLLTFIYPLFASIAVIFINNQIEHKKSRKSEKVKLRDNVLLIEKKVSTFHMCETYDSRSAIDVSTDIKRLGKEIKILINITPFYEKPFERYQKAKKNYRPILKAFRQAATNDNFQRSSFKQQQQNSPIIKKISSSSNALVDFIENNI